MFTRQQREQCERLWTRRHRRRWDARTTQSQRPTFDDSRNGPLFGDLFSTVAEDRVNHDSFAGGYFAILGFMYGVFVPILVAAMVMASLSQSACRRHRHRHRHLERNSRPMTRTGTAWLAAD